MTITRYRQFRHAMKKIPMTGKMMPYRWDSLPTSLDARWMPYAEMLDEFSRGLANVINALTNYEHRLRAWAEIVSPLSDIEKHAATHEFIGPLAIVAVNLPYVIRSRFAFAVAHLCHQVNQLKDEDWKDNLPLDQTLSQIHADCCAKFWHKYPLLNSQLKEINGSDYVAATRNFRNVYTHRLEPRFVIGVSQMVTREIRKDGVVVYAFGEKSPLDLLDIADLLVTQRDACYLAFEAFQLLVHEHADAINSYSSG